MEATAPAVDTNYDLGLEEIIGKKFLSDPLMQFIEYVLLIVWI